MSNAKQYAPYNLYAPDGTTYQLKYARSATEMGNTSVAITNGTVGVLMSHNTTNTPLAIKSSNKITQINEKSLFTFAGITNDGLEMIRYLKSKTLEENITKDREIHPLYIFDDYVYSCAHSALMGGRLVGSTGVLMCEHEGRIRITEVEANGRAYEVIGTAVGERNQSSKTVLSTKVGEINSMEISDMVELCYAAMMNAHPDTGALKKENIDCYSIKVGEGIVKREI